MSTNMIEKIIEFSAHNKFLVIVLTVVGLAGAAYSVKHIALDAIPDLSHTQVIVYSRWDRSPDVVEDQVTYPIVTSLLGAPKVKAIRGFSDFGFSYVYVIFEDGTDLYLGRSRVLEYLSKIQPRLPEGVKTELVPMPLAWAGCFNMRLSTKLDKMIWRNCAAFKIGHCDIGSNPFQVFPKWPPSADSKSNIK